MIRRNNKKKRQKEAHQGETMVRKRGQKVTKWGGGASTGEKELVSANR